MCLAIQEIREEGRLEGEIIGVIRSNKRWGIPWEDTRQYIMDEYKKSAEEFMETYWK